MAATSAKMTLLGTLRFFLFGLPVFNGFRNGGIPVFHVEVIGGLAVIVAKGGIGAVVHEANGYLRRVAGHQRRQAVYVRLVGVRSRLDKEFNEGDEVFRRFFLGADQMQGGLLAFKEAFVDVGARLDEPFVNGRGKAEEADSARLGVQSALEVRRTGVQQGQGYFSCPGSESLRAAEYMNGVTPHGPGWSGSAPCLSRDCTSGSLSSAVEFM